MADKKLALQQKIKLFAKKNPQNHVNELERLFTRRSSVVPGIMPGGFKKQLANLHGNYRKNDQSNEGYPVLQTNSLLSLHAANPFLSRDVLLKHKANAIRSSEANPSPSQSFLANSPAQTSTPKNAQNQNDTKFNYPSPLTLNRRNNVNINKRPMNPEGIHTTPSKKHQALNVYDKKAAAEGKPMNFGLVQNLAFIFVRDVGKCKIFLKCNIPGCGFKLMEENSLREHFQNAHDAVKWSGFCGVCAKIILCPGRVSLSVFDEIAHILSVHLENIKLEPLTPSTQSRFKDPRAVLNPFSPNLYSAENICNAIGTINLRPWLEADVSKKSKQAAIALLHENPLAAFFKCMQKDCVFYTCDVDVFRTHLGHHKDQTDALLCSYCAFHANSIDDLIKHLQEVHAYDTFQCIYCFYRCLGECNLLTHAKQFHSDKQTIVMIEGYRRSSKEVRDRLMLEARSEENVKKFAPPFVCYCKASFYVFNAFEKHIREHNIMTDVKKCEKCNEIVPLKDVIEHYEKCVKMSCYQCLFCSFGAQNHFKMYEHLSMDHLSCYPMYVDRMDHSTKYDVADYKSLSLKIPEHKPKNMITIRVVNDGLVLRNTEHVEHIHYNQH